MDKVSIWAQKTTCHGIVDLYDSKSFIQRLFWGLVIVAAFGAIGFYQYSVISYYLTVPTATKITKVIANKLPFPLVTICNQNIFSMKRYLPIYESFQQKFPKVFMQPRLTPTQFLGYVSFGAGYFTKLGIQLVSGNTLLLEQQYQTVFNSSTSNYSVKQFLNDTGYQCEDIFSTKSTCTLSYIAFDCCSYATQIPSDIGNCYEVTPNSGNETSVRYQVQQGSDFGMTLTLAYNDSDSPEFPGISLRNDGFDITIGEMMTKMNTARVAVAPLQQVSISLSLQKYEFDPTITTCAATPTDLAYTVDSKKSVLLCQQECQFNASIKYGVCSRVLPNVNLTPNQICSPLDYLHTYYTNSLLRNKDFLKDTYHCQQTQCPKLCHTELYVPFAVYSGITPGTSSTGITIYYGELAYTSIVESPLMDAVGLVSSFGGNLGLFAGMSLVTIVQFVAHLLFGIKSFLIRGNGKKQNTEVKGKFPLTNKVTQDFSSENNIPRPICF